MRPPSIPSSSSSAPCPRCGSAQTAPGACPTCGSSAEAERLLDAPLAEEDAEPLELDTSRFVEQGQRVPGAQQPPPDAGALSAEPVPPAPVYTPPVVPASAPELPVDTDLRMVFRELLARLDTWLTAPRLLLVVALGNLLYAGLRLRQVLEPEQFPSVVSVWLVRPLLQGIPTDVHADAKLHAVLPWLIFGFLHVLHGRVLRPVEGTVSGWQALTRAWVPGYNLPGTWRLYGQVAEAARSLRAPWRLEVLAAVGIVLLPVVMVARALVPRWLPGQDGLGLISSLDALLLAFQLLALIGAWWRLWWWAKQPRELAELELSTEDLAEPGPQPAAAPEASALDCPACTPPRPLSRVAGRLGASCPECAGGFLSPAERGQFFQELGITEAAFQQLVAQTRGEGRPLPCPSCAAPTQAVELRGSAVYPCAACQTLWLRAGGLHRLSQGRHGEARKAPARPAAQAPKPVAPGRSWPVALPPRAAGVLGALAVVGWGSGLLLSERLDCPSGTQQRRQALTQGELRGGSRVGCYSLQPLNPNVSRGALVGPVRVRDARGLLYQEWRYGETGVQEGAFREWDAFRRLRVEGWYTAGQKSQVWRSFHPDGSVTVERHYTAGRLTRLIGFYPDGTREFDAQMARDAWHGEYTAWFPNGLERVTGRFEHGKKDGTWKVFDGQGQVTREEWRHGTLEAQPQAPLETAAVIEGTAVRPTSGRPETRLYAGHDVEWWGRRLRLLRERARDETDPVGKALYALTAQRAQAHGLSVVETVLGPKAVEPAAPAEVLTESTP